MASSCGQRWKATETRSNFGHLGPNSHPSEDPYAFLSMFDIILIIDDEQHRRHQQRRKYSRQLSEYDDWRSRARHPSSSAASQRVKEKYGYEPDIATLERLLNHRFCGRRPIDSAPPSPPRSIVVSKDNDVLLDSGWTNSSVGGSERTDGTMRLSGSMRGQLDTDPDVGSPKDPGIGREFRGVTSAIIPRCLAHTEPAFAEMEPWRSGSGLLWPPGSGADLTPPSGLVWNPNTGGSVATPLLWAVLPVSSSKSGYPTFSIKGMGRLCLLTIGVFFVCTANGNGEFVKTLLTGISAATSLGTGIFSYQIADKPIWPEPWKISLTTIAAVAELGFFWGYVGFFLAGFRNSKQLAFFRTFKGAIVVTGIRLVWSLASSSANADTSNKWLNELVLLIWGTTVLAVCAAESTKVGMILGAGGDVSADVGEDLGAAVDAVVRDGENQ